MSREPLIRAYRPSRCLPSAPFPDDLAQYNHRRRPKLSDEERDEIIRQVEAGVRQTVVARRFGVSPATVCNILRKARKRLSTSR